LKDISGYDVTYAGESEGSQGVLVATTAKDPKKKRQEPLRIDYVVAKAGSVHKVRDIVTGGVSLLGNYRRQFARIMKKDGFDALLGKMQTQLDKLEKGG
jgi:phospholipid transport system substrate-binding protein